MPLNHVETFRGTSLWAIDCDASFVHLVPYHVPGFPTEEMVFSWFSARSSTDFRTKKEEYFMCPVSVRVFGDEGDFCLSRAFDAVEWAKVLTRVANGMVEVWSCKTLPRFACGVAHPVVHRVLQCLKR